MGLSHCSEFRVKTISSLLIAVSLQLRPYQVLLVVVNLEVGPCQVLLTEVRLEPEPYQVLLTAVRSGRSRSYSLKMIFCWGPLLVSFLFE